MRRVVLAGVLLVVGGCDDLLGSGHCCNDCLCPPDAGKDAPPPAPAVLAISPTSIVFPTTPVGKQTAEITGTVTNLGGSNSGPITVVVSGSGGADYPIRSTCTALGAPGNCVFSVAFAPSQPGTIPASVVISADPGGTVMAQLTGTGAPTVLVFSPATLDFDGHSRSR